METLQRLDYISFILYMLLVAGVGICFGWFVKDIKDYFKGGNTIPMGMGAISNFMGLFSTFVFVAYAGVAYEHGMVAVVVLWCTVPPAIIASLFFAKRWRRSGIITPVEYLEKRFNNGVRQLVSWTGLGMRFLDNMVRLYAIGIFLMTATPLNFFQSVVISGLIVTFFTIIGGVWAVVVINTLQFVVLVFAAVLLVPLSLNAVGGLSSFAEANPMHMQWFNGPKGQPLWLIIYYVMITLKYNANWVFIQRFYSVKDEKASVNLGYLTAALFFIFPIFFMLPAITATEIFPNLQDPEMAYVAVAVKLLPAGLMGLMLAAMFSATTSSLNSEVNVMAGVLTNDIYKRMFNKGASDKHYLWVARLNIVLVGTIITAGSLFVGKLGGAFEANKLLTGLFAIPIAIPLIFGLVLRKPNPIGAIITIILGIISGLLLNVFTNLSWEWATLIEIAICLTVFICSSFFSPKNVAKQKSLKAFFERIENPIAEKDKPVVKPEFKKMLNNIFAISLALSGILFLSMSLPSLKLLSGKISLSVSLFCIMLGGIIFIITRLKAKRQ